MPCSVIAAAMSTNFAPPIAVLCRDDFRYAPSDNGAPSCSASLRAPRSSCYNHASCTPCTPPLAPLAYLVQEEQSLQDFQTFLDQIIGEL